MDNTWATRRTDEGVFFRYLTSSKRLAGHIWMPSDDAMPSGDILTSAPHSAKAVTHDHQGEIAASNELA